MYPDVRSSGLDPVWHYYFYGAKEGRNPSALFNTSYYVATNSDVAKSGMNPLQHYISFGKAEGRSPLPTSDEAFNEERAGNNPEPVVQRKSLSDFLPPEDWSDLFFRKRMDVSNTYLRSEREVDWEKISVLTSPVLALSSIDEGKNEARSAADATGIDIKFLDHALNLASGKVLSLDIWDTILRRSCHPDETKLRSARALRLIGARGNPELMALHPIDVLKIRQIAEADVSDAAYEYRFTDVATRWLQLARCEDAQLDQEVHRIEIEIEKNASYADPLIGQLIRKHEGRAIAISDFYLSSKDLQEILGASGIVLNGTVNSSSDAMATKRRGDLFDVVLAAEEVSAQQVLHIGDRRDADVEMPRSKGLTSLLYESEADLDRTQSLALALNDHLRGDLTVHYGRILSLVCDEKRDLSRLGQPLPLEALSVVALGFAMHIIEEAVSRDVEAVHFMTREGVFFRKVYDLAVAGGIFDLPSYPRSEMLEVSRRAT